MRILDFLNFKINEEMDFKIIECDYVENSITHHGVKINTFSFTTNKGNKYTVYTHLTSESNHTLDSGINLHDISDDDIPTIYFSETKRGLNPKTFNNLTNNLEFMEVMGKVIFIINKYINNTSYKVYSIGGVDPKKESFYNKWRDKLNISSIDYGISDNYLDKFGNKVKIIYLIK